MLDILIDLSWHMSRCVYTHGCRGHRHFFLLFHLLTYRIVYIQQSGIVAYRVVYTISRVANINLFLSIDFTEQKIDICPQRMLTCYQHIRFLLWPSMNTYNNNYNVQFSKTSNIFQLNWFKIISSIIVINITVSYK